MQKSLSYKFSHIFHGVRNVTLVKIAYMVARHFIPFYFHVRADNNEICKTFLLEPHYKATS